MLALCTCHPCPVAVELGAKSDLSPTLQGHQHVACHVDFTEAFCMVQRKGFTSRLWKGQVSTFSTVGFFLNYPHPPALGVSHRPSSSTLSNLRAEVSSPRSLSLILHFPFLPVPLRFAYLKLSAVILLIMNRKHWDPPSLEYFYLLHEQGV